MTKSAPTTRNSRLTSFLRRALKSQRDITANRIHENGIAMTSPWGRKWMGAAVAAGGLLICSGPLRAVDYLWGHVGNTWELNADWVPNSGFPGTSPAGDTATFGAGAVTTVNVTTSLNVGGIFFTAPTSFTVNITSPIFTISGPGIVNTGGATQTFNNNGTGSINFASGTAGANVVINNTTTGTIQFFGTSSAAGATINNLDAGEIDFFQTSDAGKSAINNIGDGSSTQFQGASSAGSATIVNSGDFSFTSIAGDASGGKATIINGVTGILDISSINGVCTTIGSIQGGGFVELGSKNLAVGGNGKSTTFAGIIEDGGFVGSLTKVGPGALSLTGINTYTGSTTVNGGALFVNGSIASPNVFVNHEGLLGGTGTIFGSVFNHGVVKPGNSPGTLSVNGNYTQYSDGDLRIEIGSKSNYGRLKVGGAANLDGSVTAVAVDGYKPKRGDKFTVLTANGGVNGEFDQVKDNFGKNTILELGATYKSNSVILEYQRGSFLDFARSEGLSYNQRSVARALDNASSDHKEGRLLNFLDQRSLSQLPRDFDRIAPEELAASSEIGISLSNVQNANVSRHSEDLRSGSGGYTASGLSAQGSTVGYSGPITFRTGAAGPTGKESKEVFTPVEENRWGAFLTGVGEWVDVSGDGNARGYDINTGGFTLGLDYKITPNFALGVSAGYAGTSADLDGGGRVLVNGGKLGLYATYFTGGFYLDTAVTAGYNSYNSRRDGLGGSARGDTDGGEISGLIGTGYDIKSGGWSFGPTANVQYTYIAINDFQEHGSRAPLHIQNQDQESFRTAVGFRASYDIKLRGGGILIRPEVRAAWQHEFGDDAYTVDASFRSGGGSVFSVDGPEMGRDSLLLGAGVVVLFSDRVSTYLYYDGQLARTNYESHSISGGVRIAF
jgi:outer membrane autotransporter protein